MNADHGTENLAPDLQHSLARKAPAVPCRQAAKDCRLARRTQLDTPVLEGAHPSDNLGATHDQVVYGVVDLVDILAQFFERLGAFSHYCPAWFEAA